MSENLSSNKNTVELLGTYGSDETHAQSAWTSTIRDLEIIEEKTGLPRKSRIPSLLAQLAQAEPVPHRSPFEKSLLHFLVTTDIATHIHLIKHRVGVSVNGESARYKELKDDKFYLPTDWDEEERAKLDSFMMSAYLHYHGCYDRLIAKGYSKKRAKESSRFYLPYANQITADVAFNFTSFVNFQIQRNDEHAQLEVHDVADQMLKLVVETAKFPHTIAAWAPRVEAFKKYVNVP